jgi:hypothetical protein
MFKDNISKHSFIKGDYNGFAGYGLVYKIARSPNGGWRARLDTSGRRTEYYKQGLAPSEFEGRTLDELSRTLDAIFNTVADYEWAKPKARRLRNPDDPRDTSWLKKKLPPLNQDREAELESLDTEIKPFPRASKRVDKFSGSVSFCEDGGECSGGAQWGRGVQNRLISNLESPLARYAPKAEVTRFVIKRPDDLATLTLVYGYDPLMRFGEGGFFCDIYRRFSEKESPEKLVDIGWRLKDIGNKDVLSAIEEYGFLDQIPLRHLADLKRGRPFIRDNTSKH